MEIRKKRRTVHAKDLPRVLDWLKENRDVIHLKKTCKQVADEAGEALDLVFSPVSIDNIRKHWKAILEDLEFKGARHPGKVTVLEDNHLDLKREVNGMKAAAGRLTGRVKKLEDQMKQVTAREAARRRVESGAANGIPE